MAFDIGDDVYFNSAGKEGLCGQRYGVSHGFADGDNVGKITAIDPPRKNGKQVVWIRRPGLRGQLVGMLIDCMNEYSAGGALLRGGRRLRDGRRFRELRDAEDEGSGSERIGLAGGGKRRRRKSTRKKRKSKRKSTRKSKQRRFK